VALHAIFYLIGLLNHRYNRNRTVKYRILVYYNQLDVAESWIKFKRPIYIYNAQDHHETNSTSPRIRASNRVHFYHLFPLFSKVYDTMLQLQTLMLWIFIPYMWSQCNLQRRECFLIFVLRKTFKFQPAVNPIKRSMYRSLWKLNLSIDHQILIHASLLL